MRLHRALALGASLLVLLSACTTGGGSKPAITIGSDGFYESQVVAEMYAQALENAGYTVERNLGLGARAVTTPAIESGQIDLKPEYIGSGLGYYDPAKTTSDPAANATALEEILATKGGGISIFDYSPGEDTNAFVVRQDTADQYGLTRMSDLAPIQDELTWGLPPECETNPLCGAALSDAYGIEFPPQNLESLAACDAPIAEALNNGAIDVAELCSTQPAIGQFGFIVLEDDKNTQPAENIAPIVRDSYLEQLSETDRTQFRELLDGVTALLTTDALIDLGVEINVEQREIADVATDFLEANGLLQ